MTPKLQLTKIDCAKRQLETAIRLYFTRGDPVSIHTLASAAYSIVHDLNKQRGGAAMVRDCEIIKPQFKEMVRRKLTEHQNFFKHADRDPEKTVEFNPELTEGFLAESCIKYYQLTREKVPALHIYVQWECLWNPEMWENKDSDTLKKMAEIRQLFTREMREQYYRSMMTAACAT
ncbi:MAG: hypothetical protein M3Z64_02690 [Verrucomicrobiota bacterium]|nr:hypothetical protein [Verrucomicrobiota bacterium]